MGCAAFSLQGSRMDEQRCSFPPPLKVGLDASPTPPFCGRLAEQRAPKGLGMEGDGDRGGRPPS